MPNRFSLRPGNALKIVINVALDSLLAYIRSAACTAACIQEIHTAPPGRFAYPDRRLGCKPAAAAAAAVAGRRD